MKPAVANRGSLCFCCAFPSSRRSATIPQQAPIIFAKGDSNTSYSACEQNCHTCANVWWTRLIGGICLTGFEAVFGRRSDLNPARQNRKDQTNEYQREVEQELQEFFLESFSFGMNVKDRVGEKQRHYDSQEYPRYAHKSTIKKQDSGRVEDGGVPNGMADPSQGVPSRGFM